MNKEAFSNLDKSSGSVITARYVGKPKQLLNYIDMLEKSGKYEAVWVYAPDEQTLFEDFKSLYRLEKAVGCLIFNPDQQIRILADQGRWQLPAGKVEEEHSSETAALEMAYRETGLDTVRMINPLPETYHTSRNEQQERVLFLTRWFRLSVRSNQPDSAAAMPEGSRQWKEITELMNNSDRLPVRHKNLLENTISCI